MNTSGVNNEDTTVMSSDVIMVFLFLTLTHGGFVSDFNPFLTNVPISYPLKTPINQWFSEGYTWEH